MAKRTKFSQLQVGISDTLALTIKKVKSDSQLTPSNNNEGQQSFIGNSQQTEDTTIKSTGRIGSDGSAF